MNVNLVDDTLSVLLSARPDDTLARRSVAAQAGIGSLIQL